MLLGGDPKAARRGFCACLLLQTPPGEGKTTALSTGADSSLQEPPCLRAQAVPGRSVLPGRRGLSRPLVPVIRAKAQSAELSRQDTQRQAVEETLPTVLIHLQKNQRNLPGKHMPSL